MNRLGDALAIVRVHILGVAVAATLVFSWLTTGKYQPLVAALAGTDWFLINLVNRITDVDEDRVNQIRGTECVARRPGALLWLAALVAVATLAATAWWAPALVPVRLAVQLIGLAYSYRLVPTGRGLRRLKEIYFLKNFMSAVLFVLTCFVYPIAAGERVMPLAGVVALVLFFIPFEITFEILYDLRDLEGDRRATIPTFPVVHGARRARQIVDGLLLFSVLVLAVGFASGVLGVREGLFVAAPAIQLALYRPRFRRGINAHDCILITHVNTAELVLFLVGTAVWIRLGLPANLSLS